VFSGLSSLVIDDVTDQDELIVVRARTAGGPLPCPRCGARTGQVHGYYERTIADVPADGRPVVVRVRVRRMRCPVPGCPAQTFREQVPGVLDRYQRRTTRLAGQAVPRVLGVDDFALRRGQVYATILIDAETGQRVDVLASRKADVLEAWLRGHPCRGGPPRAARRGPGR